MLLLIPTVPLCLIVLCIIIHFRQHFRFQWCTYRPLSGFTCCGVHNVAQFDFFPVSFLLYMVMIAIVSTLIILKYILNLNSNLSPKRLSEISDIDLYLYCLIVIVSLWDSLFSFYRYYTTRTLSIRLHSITLCTVLKTFSLYILVFIPLFLLQTQLYYYLFAPIILSHFFVHLYWILSTTRIIMNTATHVDVANQKEEIEFLRNLILMRYLSVLSSLCSSIYIAMLMMTYTMDIVYYFPLVWSVSITLFACNFVRNRQYLKHLTHIMPKCTTIHQTDINFMVYVENVNEKQKKKKKEIMKTPLSVPIITCHNSVHDGKSHSTGNLRSFLPKSKLKLVPLSRRPLQQQNSSNRTTSPTYITPSTASPMPMQMHPMATPMSQLNDGTVYCDVNGEFPALHINVTLANEAESSDPDHPDPDIDAVKDHSVQLSQVSAHKMHKSFKEGIKSHSCQELKLYSESVHAAPENKLDALAKPMPPVLKRSWTVAKPVHNSSATPVNKLGLLDIPETPASLIPISVQNHRNRNHLDLDIDPVNTRSVPTRIMHQNQNSENQSKHRSSHSKDHLQEELQRENRYRRRYHTKIERQTSTASVLHLFVAQGFCDGLME